MRRILFFLTVLFLTSCSGKLYRSYRSGYYYNSAGQKKVGLIDFEPYLDRVHFKANKNASSETLKLDQLTAIVVDHDSLSVQNEGNSGNKRYFAKLYFKTPVTKFYYKFIETNTGSVNYSTLSNVPNSGNNGVHTITRVTPGAITTTDSQFIMYQDGNTTFRLTKGNYIEVLSKAFADVPDLVQKIQKKEFKFKQVGDAINWYINKSTYRTYE